MARLRAHNHVAATPRTAKTAEPKPWRSMRRAPRFPPAPSLARVATARSSKRQAHAGPASGRYRPRASLQSTRSNERTESSNRERHWTQNARATPAVQTTRSDQRRHRRGESTHTRNPGTQRPGRRHSAVECRLHNDRELSCKDRRPCLPPTTCYTSARRQGGYAGGGNRSSLTRSPSRLKYSFRRPRVANTPYSAPTSGPRATTAS